MTTGAADQNPPRTRDGAGQEGNTLTAAVLAAWLLAAGPAYLMDGTLGLEGALYAAILCILPGWLVLLGTGLSRVAARPTTQVTLGMLLRMAFAFGGVFLLRAVRPELGFRSFLVWLVLFYLVALAVETFLLTRHLSGASPKQPVSAGEDEVVSTHSAT